MIRYLIIAISISCVFAGTAAVNAAELFSVSALGFRVHSNDAENKTNEEQADAGQGESDSTPTPASNQTDTRNGDGAKKNSGALGFDILRRLRKKQSEQSQEQSELPSSPTSNEAVKSPENEDEQTDLFSEKIVIPPEVPPQSTKQTEDPAIIDSFDPSSLRNDVTRFTPLKADKKSPQQDIEREVTEDQQELNKNTTTTGEVETHEQADAMQQKAELEKSDVAAFQSVREFVLSGRETHPQFVSKIAQFGVSNEKNISPYLSYMVYWMKVYSALEYDAFKRDSDAVIVGIPSSVASNNQVASEVSKETRRFKFFPVNWISRFRRLNFSYGLLYQNQSLKRAERVIEAVKIDNEMTLQLNQFGVQGSMLYHRRFVDFRLRLNFPIVNQLSVTEKYFYQDENVAKDYDYSGNETSDLAFDASIELLFKTPVEVNFLFAAGYQYLPLSYDKVVVETDIDEQVDFKQTKSDEKLTTFSLSASVIFESLQFWDFSPYLQLSARRDLTENKRLNVNTTENALLIQLGISSQF